MGNSAKRDAREAAARERRQKALVLRRQGHSYNQIAEALGYTDKSNASKDVKKALAELIDVETVKEVRELENARLDVLWSKLQPKINAGDTRAVTAAVQVQQRRAKLLGLDARPDPDIQVNVAVSLEPLSEDQLKGLTDEELDARIVALEAAQRRIDAVPGEGGEGDPKGEEGPGAEGKGT